MLATNEQRDQKRRSKDVNGGKSDSGPGGWAGMARTSVDQVPDREMRELPGQELYGRAQKATAKAEPRTVKGHQS